MALFPAVLSFTPGYPDGTCPVMSHDWVDCCPYFLLHSVDVLLLQLNIYMLLSDHCHSCIHGVVSRLRLSGMVVEGKLALVAQGDACCNDEYTILEQISKIDAQCPVCMVL